MKTFDEIEKNNGQLSLLQVAEEHGTPQPRNAILPGRFYALKIISPTPSLGESQVKIISEGKPYYDVMPVGLSLYYENWNSTGVVLMLNLRVMPTSASSFLLESYYRKFASIFGLQNLFKEGELIPLEERNKPGANQAFYFTPAFFNGLGKDLNFVINKYKIDQIAEAKLIDWDKFGWMVKPKFSGTGLFPENLNIVEVFETVNEKLLNS